MNQHRLMFIDLNGCKSKVQVRQQPEGHSTVVLNASTPETFFRNTKKISIVQYSDGTVSFSWIPLYSLNQSW